MVSSYVGENQTFAKQYLAGELEIEFNPQGTLAERIRAGGAGIPAFFTKTGVGTEVAKGKPTQEFDGETFVMERGIFADLALVHAYMATTRATSAYRRTARNFNPIMATAAKVTVRQVEHWCARRDRPGPRRHARRLREAHGRAARGLREAHRAAHRAEARAGRRRRRGIREGTRHALDPRRDGGPRRRASCRTASTSTSASASRRWWRTTCRPA
jgi:hypothetical protein